MHHLLHHSVLPRTQEITWFRIPKPALLLNGRCVFESWDLHASCSSAAPESRRHSSNAQYSIRSMQSCIQTPHLDFIFPRHIFLVPQFPRWLSSFCNYSWLSTHCKRGGMLNERMARAQFHLSFCFLLCKVTLAFSS